MAGAERKDQGKPSFRTAADYKAYGDYYGPTVTSSGPGGLQPGPGCPPAFDGVLMRTGPVLSSLRQAATATRRKATA